jgi:hypothetical protein
MFSARHRKPPVPLDAYDSGLLGRTEAAFLALFHRTNVYLLRAATDATLPPASLLPRASADALSSAAGGSAANASASSSAAGAAPARPTFAVSALAPKRAGSNKLVCVDARGLERKFAAADAAAAERAVAFVAKWLPAAQRQ